MRTYTLLTASLALWLCVMPALAGAQIYLGPEDVLYLNTQEPQRINRRSAPKLVEEREKAIGETKKDDRPTLVEWWTVSSSSASSVAPAAGGSVSSAPTHSAAPENDDDLENLDAVTLRLLRRLNQKESGNVTPPATVLHGGAPLSHTGPESILTLLAMAPAAAYVIRRARGMQKFVRF